jgi:hydroxymethylpyrimidine pyrophosphatase-like HAD family hydrolase
VVFGTGDVAWLDIGPKGVSKATMLARLCERLDIDPALTMTVGDSMNDIEMLKWAGVGVLMGHAGPEMRQYADVVTDPRPGFGVAEALNAIRV